MKASDFKNSKQFDNMFTFMNFCYEHHLTPDNSFTSYDEENDIMTLYFN